MSIPDDLEKWLKKTPNRANWKKVCDLLDACPAPLLDAALARVDEAAGERWDVDTNASPTWPMPARYTPGSWAKRLLAGEAPPALAAVRFLQLHEAKVLDDGVERMLSTSALGRITHLYLASCRLGDGALAALASHHGQLAALTHLVLSDNPIGQAGFDALFRSPLAQRLVSFHLRGGSLDNVDALLAAPPAALRVLLLDLCGLTADQVEAVRSALPALTTFSAELAG